MNYKYVTRKQANIIYAAIKRGELNAPKSFVQALYTAVGDSDNITFVCTVPRIIDHIFNNRFELAQAEINGKVTAFKTVATKTIARAATIDDWFFEVGEMIEEQEEIKKWIVTEHNNGI